MLKLTQVRDLSRGDNRYRRKIIIRFAALSLCAFFLAQVIPTLADEQNHASELTSEVAPGSDSQTADSLLPSDSQTPISDTPTSTASPTPTPSPTVYPARPSESQGMNLEVPTEISVDPRAQVVRVPPINVSGPEFLLVCINTVNTVVDILTIGAPDNANATNLFIRGDLSSTLFISAPTTLINNVLNASGGAKVSALGSHIAGQQIHIGFLAVDKIATDQSLCTRISPANRRAIQIKSLGLGIGMKKGEVTLKR